MMQQGVSASPVDPGSLRAVFESAVVDAVMAPSSHNTQPWRFRITGTSVDLLADRTRALPVADPEDRELVISCGAALFQLRLGLRRQGCALRVDAFPDPLEPDLLARVQVVGWLAVTSEESALADAIPLRRTNRQKFFGLEVPADVIQSLVDAAALEGGCFQPLRDEGPRTRLVALVMEGDHHQWSDSRFRHELAAWMRPDGDPRRDGLFGHAPHTIASHMGPHVVRTFDLGTGQAAHDRDLADGSPLLAVVSTPGDTPRDWLAAGQALDRVLLLAAIEGLGVSFLNQPVEEPDLRSLLDDVLTTPGRSQVVLRLGYAPPVTASIRRALSDVMV